MNTVANIPVICGGGHDTATKKSCVQLSSDRWEKYATLIEPRSGQSGWVSAAALVLMSGTTTEIVPNGGLGFTLMNYTQ